MNGRQDRDGRYGRVVLLAAVVAWCVSGAGAAEADKRAQLRDQLKKVPYKIVYESYRGKDWDLFVMKADGSGGRNLTKTPDVDDMYPHASPDGKRVAFVVDAGAGKDKSRSVYVIGIDSAGRKRIASNARQPCWGPKGQLACLPGEFERFTYKDYATKGLVIHDVKTGRQRPHVNARLHHLYNPCWSPDGKWFAATVHGGMGHKHANLVFEADGTKVFKLPGVGGCRPDFSPDGKRISWNLSDYVIAVADVQLGPAGPKVSNIRKAITCDKQHEVYHSDWSPDGKYIAFSYGPKGGEQVGTMAKGWHICVADAAQDNVWVPVTTDGVSNKEPDWVPAAATGKQAIRVGIDLKYGTRETP